MAHTIELKKVSKYYAGEDSVSMGFSRIDLDLDIGEFVAITGESGSGKSTLLNVISGLDTYEEGEMFVCGEDTTAYGTEDYEIYRKTYIGNIFQDFNLINSYTVYQNIEVVMLLSGRKRKECRERVLELIDKVGLSEYRRTKVSRLSGGQKQRVAIARALAKDAPIIVADEPTGNLDSKSAESVMETLHKVSDEKLVVIVTHNYEQAEPYVTRKLTMHDGKIIEDKRLSLSPSDESVSYLDVLSSNGSDVLQENRPEDAYLDHEKQQDEGSEDLSEEEQSSNSDAATEAKDDPAPGEEKDSAEEPENSPKDSPDSGKRDKKGRRSRSRKSGNRTVRADVAGPQKMRKSAEVRLGIRNTFNLPAKFMLLFIVYFFVSTAVLSQYATTKNSMHESELLGTNQYFTNSSSDRIIVKKQDESRFSEEDFDAVLNSYNVKSIVKNDLAVDSGVSFSLGDFYVEGPVMPVSEISESDIIYGHMPENEYEIVIKLDTTSDAFINMGDSGEAYIDKEVTLEDMSQMQKYSFDKPIKVAGIIAGEETEESDFDVFGYSTIYAGDAVCRELLISMMAGSSSSVLNFDGTKVDSESEQNLFTSANVPSGKVYIFEDETYYYKDEKAVGKDFSVTVKNRFFESTGKYTVDKVITSDNCRELVGIPKDEYDMYYNAVFISNKDFKKLFDKGYYQISAFMQNETDSDRTIAELNSKGFTTLALKDSLSDMTGGYDVVVNMLSYGRLILIFIVLFFIAYGVIKLIMRSRNTYYSTLRILGATKKNTDAILRVELILMMLIAYAVDMLFVVLVKLKYINIKSMTKLLYFLTPWDYGLLAALLLLMSLLIANRYSRSIFTRSAMKAFREEA